MQITVNTGHLTAKNKAVVAKMIADGISQGRSGRTDYAISLIKPNTYQVDMYIKDKGLIQCAGSALRLSKYSSVITVKN